MNTDVWHIGISLIYFDENLHYEQKGVSTLFGILKRY